MPYRGLAPGIILLAVAIIGLSLSAQTSSNKATPGKAGGDVELVEKLIVVRRDYQKTMENLLQHYQRVGDLERVTWAKEEIVAFHRMPKHAYILDLDVPPPNLTGHQNVPEANQLYMLALKYKGNGWSATDYLDNQRRAELLLQEMLNKYPHSDKISDAAYQLGDIYESKANKQYRRSARYFERCFQWNPKTNLDARLRAARIYDLQLKDRSRAIELYREITTHETDPKRHAEATKRLSELSAAASR